MKLSLRKNIKKAIMKANDRVLDEIGKIACSTCSRKMAIIFRPSVVIMVGKNMGAGVGDAATQKQIKLKETRRAPIAVTERMYPHEIHMSDNGFYDAIPKIRTLFRRIGKLVSKPVTHRRDKARNSTMIRCAVSADNNFTRPKHARDRLKRIAKILADV